MEDIKIHDIKALVEIPDFSIYLYMLLWILGCVILFALIFLIYKIIKNRKKDFRKKYYKVLKEIDLNEPKKSAYTITKYSRLLATSQREIKLAEELIDELEKYKYKKEVDQIDDGVKILFGRFMDNIDV